MSSILTITFHWWCTQLCWVLCSLFLQLEFLVREERSKRQEVHHMILWILLFQTGYRHLCLDLSSSLSFLRISCILPITGLNFLWLDLSLVFVSLAPSWKRRGERESRERSQVEIEKVTSDSEPQRSNLLLSLYAIFSTCCCGLHRHCTNSKNEHVRKNGCMTERERETKRLKNILLHTNSSGSSTMLWEI